VVPFRTSHVGTHQPRLRPRASPSAPIRRNAGFTIVEILIVVVILAILAMLVIPIFSDTDRTARENTLRKHLQSIRGRIEVYRTEHLDEYPASVKGDDGDTFIAQMTGKTNEEGEYGGGADPPPSLGPYLPKLPPNPFATANADKVDVDKKQKADGDPGWYYNPETGEFRANDPDHAGL
jgi:general secretion pathway protein G